MSMTMAEEYEWLEEVGKGNFSVVRQAIIKATGERVAIKIIDVGKFEKFSEGKFSQYL
jgi:hypothetical protein